VDVRWKADSLFAKSEFAESEFAKFDLNRSPRQSCYACLLRVRDPLAGKQRATDKRDEFAPLHLTLKMHRYRAHSATPL
jgi:hypothetical protein